MDIASLKHLLPTALWHSLKDEKARGRQFSPSAQILNWLNDEGSLTQRLIKFSNDQFSVNLLSQKDETIYSNEALALNVIPQSIANVREVFLLCTKNEVVFARTVFPLSTLTGNLQELLQLKNKPLGAYLFSQPDMIRDPIEITQIQLPSGEVIWGRRSVFYISDKPLLVSEYFLPALLNP
jgi:chorismate--pyruvate lyase